MIGWLRRALHVRELTDAAWRIKTLENEVALKRDWLPPREVEAVVRYAALCALTYRGGASCGPIVDQAIADESLSDRGMAIVMEVVAKVCFQELEDGLGA